MLLGMKYPIGPRLGRYRWGKVATRCSGAGRCAYEAPASVEVASVIEFSQQPRCDSHSAECSQPWYSLCTSAWTVFPSAVWVAVIHSRLSYEVWSALSWEGRTTLQPGSTATVSRSGPTIRRLFRLARISWTRPPSSRKARTGASGKWNGSDPQWSSL